MSFQLPIPTEERYIIHKVAGRRPTEQGFQYLIQWEMDDGSIETSPEYSYFLEQNDYDTWAPLLDTFDRRYPDSEAVIGDWTGF